MNIEDEFNLWINEPSTDNHREFDAFLYMNKDGRICLEWDLKKKKTTKAFFDLDEEDRFRNTLRAFNITLIDVSTKMEGYTFLPEWQKFIYNSMIGTWRLQ